MKYNELFLSQHTFCSDDDCPVVEEIFVGYNESLDLIVLLEHTDYDKPENNCCTYAKIKKANAFKLAKRLRASMTELPGIINDSMEEYADIINPTPGQARDCFRDILNRLSYEKCKFQLIRTYGPHGYHCF